MDDWGFQVFDDDDDTIVVWDSALVAGGVIAHVGAYQPAETAVLTFPSYAGRSVQIVPSFGWFYAASATVVADTALGWPRVTVTASNAVRRFFVVVY